MGRVPLILHHLHHVAIVQVETIDAHLTAHSLPSHGDTTSHRPLSEASGIAALDGLSHPLRQLSQDFNATSMSPEEAMGPSDAPDSTTIDFFTPPEGAFTSGSFFDQDRRTRQTQSQPNSLLPLLLLAGVAVLGAIIIVRANFVMVCYRMSITESAAQEMLS